MTTAQFLPRVEPFPYLVRDSFLPSDLAEELATRVRGDLDFEKHPAGYQFAPMYHERLIRHLYGFIRSDVRQALGMDYTFSKVYRIPQVYKIQGPWAGLPPHTDNQTGRDLAMIIYMSRGWRPRFGGELNLLTPAGEPFARIEPLFNRAVFFPLGAGSWHSVSPLSGDWPRITLIQDWERKSLSSGH